MKKKKTPSEGELFILEYLKFMKIDFEREVKLTHLKYDDHCTYRIADFYLKKYKVYLEFNGRWNNNKEDRIRYRTKKEVYKKNKLPCIYIYPENLGIIEFVFPKRLIEVFKYHSLKKELLKFQFKRFIDDRGGLFLWLFICILILSTELNWEEDNGTIIFLTAIVIYQVYRLFKGVYKFFIKNDHAFDNRLFL